MSLKVRHICDNCNHRFELPIEAVVIGKGKQVVAYKYVRDPVCPECGSAYLRMLSNYYKKRMTHDRTRR